MKRSRKSILCLLVFCIAFANAASLGVACDTPVYRYAMYRWPASKYYVFFVHEGEPNAEQKAVNRAIQEIEAAEDPKPNIVFFDIAAKEIDSAPPIAADHWNKIGKPKSTYIVVAPPPLGGVVFAGDLNLDEVRSMIASPLRTEIANRLEEGAATVFVVLEADEKANAKTADADGKNADENGVTNAVAVKITEQIVGRVNVGDVSLYATPVPGEPPSEQPLKPEHKIAMVKLSRDNPDEQWLIRMLLAVEADLPEFNQPMVFPVYGRGRVHPPFIGLGVTEDNLVEAVQFVTGACSCTVKEQNPGVDLLFDYDWESAAVAMAEKFGAEEGNEQLGAADLFPQLIIPGEGPDEPETAAETTDVTAESTASPSGGAESNETPPTSQSNGATNAEGPSADTPSTERQVARVETSTPTPESESAVGSYTSIWAVAGVLAAVVAGLFVATLIILRPR